MSDLRLVPSRKEKLGDQLYGQILDQIVSGALKAGDKLPSENQVCHSFGVSRPTVREALMRLHADGLVTTRQGSGTFVLKRPSNRLTRFASGADIAGLLRCLEVRIALEGQAAVLAAERRTTEQMDEIARALTALQVAFQNGHDLPIEADYDFHRAIARASGNILFADMLESLTATIRHGMSLALSLTREGSKERSRRVVEEHEAITEAIAGRDAEAAGLAMRYHLHRARQRVTDGSKDI